MELVAAFVIVPALLTLWAIRLRLLERQWQNRPSCPPECASLMQAAFARPQGFTPQERANLKKCPSCYHHLTR